MVTLTDEEKQILNVITPDLSTISAIDIQGQHSSYVRKMTPIPYRDIEANEKHNQYIASLRDKRVYENIKQFLIEHNLLRTKEPFNPSSGLVLTDEGIKMVRAGSYESYINKISDDEKRLAELENRQARLETEQLNLAKHGLWVNRMIAVATSVAALYYLLEILNHFYHIYPICH